VLGEADVAEVAARVVRWALDRPAVRGVALAGSWARGQPRAGSDVDLVVLTDDEPLDVADALPADAVDLGSRRWGPLHERRFRLTSGLEVDLGLAPLSWAAVPVDHGTARVVAGGLRVLWDPDGLLTRLVGKVAGPS
jgi:hypothetical protein